MEFKTWNFENDTVDTKQKPLFSAAEKHASGYTGAAYGLDSAKGIFFQQASETCPEEFDLVQIDKEGESIVMENIAVIASNLKYSAMIVHVINTGENYLLDTRGIFFFLDISETKDDENCLYGFFLDRKTGYYNVKDHQNVRWLLRGVSKKKMFVAMIESTPDLDLVLNKDFNRLLKENPSIRYLYLTLPDTKKGKTFQRILDTGIAYEPVPNIFTDDNSRNIRIPYSEENLANEAFQYLDARYHSTYAIKGVEIEALTGMLEIDIQTKNAIHGNLVSPSDKKFRIGTSVLGTLRNLYQAETDTVLYTKCIKKIWAIFEKGEKVPYANRFNELWLEYPEYPDSEDEEKSKRTNKAILTSHHSYIKDTLHLQQIKNMELMDASDLFFFCKSAYAAASAYRKSQIVAFEERINDQL